MTRSKWKTPFIDKSLFKKLNASNENRPIWSRRSTIYPVAVGLKVQIHNGKDMVRKKIRPEMVGHKLGELVPTRKTYVQKKKKVSPQIKKT